MFASSYQGGAFVEVFSAQGKNPITGWKIAGNVKKTYETEVKGYVYTCEGGPATKMHVPKDSAQSSASANPLHAQLPLSILRRGEWITLCLDIGDIVQHSFPGSVFRSMEALSVSAHCKLRRIFTLKSPPMDSDGVPKDVIPRSVDYSAAMVPKPAIQCINMNSFTSKADDFGGVIGKAFGNGGPSLAVNPIGATRGAATPRKSVRGTATSHTSSSNSGGAKASASNGRLSTSRTQAQTPRRPSASSVPETKASKLPQPKDSASVSGDYRPTTAQRRSSSPKSLHDGISSSFSARPPSSSSRPPSSRIPLRPPSSSGLYAKPPTPEKSHNDRVSQSRGDIEILSLDTERSQRSQRPSSSRPKSSQPSAFNSQPSSSSNSSPGRGESSSSPLSASSVRWRSVRTPSRGFSPATESTSLEFQGSATSSLLRASPGKDHLVRVLREDPVLPLEEQLSRAVTPPSSSSRPLSGGGGRPMTGSRSVSKKQTTTIKDIERDVRDLVVKISVANEALLPSSGSGLSSVRRLEGESSLRSAPPSAHRKELFDFSSIKAKAEEDAHALLSARQGSKSGPSPAPRRAAQEDLSPSKASPAARRREEYEEEAQRSSKDSMSPDSYLNAYRQSLHDASFTSSDGGREVEVEERYYQPNTSANTSGYISAQQEAESDGEGFEGGDIDLHSSMEGERRLGYKNDSYIPHTEDSSALPIRHIWPNDVGAGEEEEGGRAVRGRTEKWVSSDPEENDDEEFFEHDHNIHANGFSSVQARPPSSHANPSSAHSPWAIRATGRPPTAPPKAEVGEANKEGRPKSGIVHQEEVKVEEQTRNVERRASPDRKALASLSSRNFQQQPEEFEENELSLEEETRRFFAEEEPQEDTSVPYTTENFADEEEDNIEDDMKEMFFDEDPQDTADVERTTQTHNALQENSDKSLQSNQQEVSMYDKSIKSSSDERPELDGENPASIQLDTETAKVASEGVPSQQKPMLVVTGDHGEPQMELIFDPILNCYYDAKTDKYYQLRQ